MPRAKRGFKRRRKVKKVLDRAEGYVGGRRTIYRRAEEQVNRSMVYAYGARRRKKRDFRGLWISRIGAAASSCGMSYSRLFGALIKGNVTINRKMLSEIAIHDPKAFSLICDKVRNLAPAI